MIDRTTDPVGWAEGVLKHIHDEQTRWGRQYSVATDRVYPPSDIAQAAGIIMLEMETRSTITPEELTKVKRQLTASKARETKAGKKLAKVREELSESQQELQNLGLELDTALNQLKRIGEAEEYEQIENILSE